MVEFNFEIRRNTRGIITEQWMDWLKGIPSLHALLVDSLRSQITQMRYNKDESQLETTQHTISISPDG